MPKNKPEEKQLGEEVKEELNEKNGPKYLKRKDILPAFRANRRNTDKNTESITQMQEALEDLKEELKELKALVKGSTKQGKPSGEIPESIRSSKDVVLFIENHPDLGWEWGTEHHNCKKEQSEVVADLLAEHYTDIERVNNQKEHHGYEAGPEKHKDAVVFIPDPNDRKLDQIFDITIASSDPGSILSLDGKHDACWRHEEIYPAGWENKPTD